MEKNESSSKQLGFVFDKMCCGIGNWKQFAKTLEIEYLFRDLEGEEKYKEMYEKINKCINEKIESSKEQLDWYYWRNVLLRIGENDLADDIEDHYPRLLKDERIELSYVNHQIIDGFTTIVSHHADRAENFDNLPVKFKDKIKICIGAGECKLYSREKVEEMSGIFDDYFNKYDILNNIRKYDFSNVNESEECLILKTQHAWLKENDDQGFTIKGYDANAHLQLFSNHVNTNPQKDSILTYSPKHNILLHINKAKTHIKKAMRENCLSIRPLQTIHKCLNLQSYTYLPITLHSYRKDEVYDIVKCKTCLDLNLLEMSETFTNLEALREWWEKVISQVKEIRNEQNKESDDISDISNQFLQNILGFFALANFDLPSFTKNPEKEIKEIQKLIMFTPEQQDIIYSKCKRKLVKGSFGSGKTLAAQQLVKLVVSSMSALEFLYYIIHDNNTIYIHEMIKFAETFKENVRACTYSCLTRDNNSLSAIFQHLIRIHKGNTVHVFVEEFNGEILDKEEVEEIVNLLENEIFKNSHIVLICQSMESERYLIQKKDRISYNRYQFSKLSEQADFKIFPLSYLLRCSQHINNIVDVAVKVLDKSVTEFVVPKLELKPNFKSAIASSIKKDLKIKSLASNELTETTIIQPNSAQNIEQIVEPEHSGEKSVDTSDTDKLLKYFTLNSNEYISKMEIESSYSFVGQRKSAQFVCGRKPVVYLLFNEEIEEGNKSYSNQVYCLSKVLKKIDFPTDKDKQIVICMNDESKYLVQDSLKVNNLKWTSDPQLLTRTEVNALLKDYSSVRGCEFLNVILLVPIDEQHLKHNLVGCLSRCVLSLILIFINKGDPDKTFVEILNTLKNKDFVVIDNENYLLNIKKKELEEFNEVNKLLIMKDKQNKIMDVDADVIFKLFRNKQFTPNNDKMDSLEAPASVAVFQDIWETCKKATNNNNPSLLTDAFERYNLDVNTIYYTINDRFSYTGGLLYHAVDKIDIDIVKFLLALNNIDVNKVNDRGWTPLMLAAYHHNIDLVGILLNMENIDVDKAIDIVIPLMLTTRDGYDEIVELLLKNSS